MSNNLDNERASEHEEHEKRDEPFLATILFILGFAVIIASLILGVHYWPEPSYKGEAVSPIISIAVFVGGILQSLVYFALGSILGSVSRLEKK